MGILCRLGQHQAPEQVRRNGPLSFGRCRGCGRDLILSVEGWRPVPTGYRVVWRQDRPERLADLTRLALALPESRSCGHAQRIARVAGPGHRRLRPITGRELMAAPSRPD